MVDGLILSGSYILAVAEVKKTGLTGMWQLLGALIKVWSNTGIYPVGKWNCTKRLATFVIVIPIITGLLIGKHGIEVFYPQQSYDSHRFKVQRFEIVNFTSLLDCLALVKNQCFEVYNHYQRRRTLRSTTLPKDFSQLKLETPECDEWGEEEEEERTLKQEVRTLKQEVETLKQEMKTMSHNIETILQKMT